MVGWYSDKKTTDQYIEEKRLVFSFDLREWSIKCCSVVKYKSNFIQLRVCSQSYWSIKCCSVVKYKSNFIQLRVCSQSYWSIKCCSVVKYKSNFIQLHFCSVSSAHNSHNRNQTSFSLFVFPILFSIKSRSVVKYGSDFIQLHLCPQFSRTDTVKLEKVEINSAWFICTEINSSWFHLHGNE